MLAKARFWQHWAGTPLNDRQIKLLNKLLDGFEGKLTSSKWAAVAKCSQDTALRDITELLERGVLKKSEASGRSTSYELMPVGDRACSAGVDDTWGHLLLNGARRRPPSPRKI